MGTSDTWSCSNGVWLSQGPVTGMLGEVLYVNLSNRACPSFSQAAMACLITAIAPLHWSMMALCNHF